MPTSDQIHSSVEIAGAIVTIASLLSATLGLHKYNGILGAIGKAIAVIGINIGKAKNQ